ncbi:MAG: hypothetical protein JOZ29_15925 [Deltaproteobacteria bacterium]|nr:hypothetical protein [Deltaproteobacteria bacterium]MBV8453738.1 hypothetical protein [Deltaproteobacteria bacterium]
MRRRQATGGAGFISTNPVHYWRSRHPQDLTVVLDASSHGGNQTNQYSDWIATNYGSRLSARHTD